MSSPAILWVTGMQLVHAIPLMFQMRDDMPQLEITYSPHDAVVAQLVEQLHGKE